MLPVLPHSVPRSQGSVRRASLTMLMDQGTMLLMIAIGSLILLLALLILFHENATATKGYRLRSLEYERSQLLLEREILKMQIATEQSLESMQQDQRILSMPQARSVQYADALPTVALRKDASRH